MPGKKSRIPTEDGNRNLDMSLSLTAGLTSTDLFSTSEAGLVSSVASDQMLNLISMNLVVYPTFLQVAPLCGRLLLQKMTSLLSQVSC